MQNKNYRMDEDRTDENGAGVMEEFTEQQRVKHVETCIRMKYIARRYRRGPDADAVELLQHMLQDFIARKWNKLNRQKALERHNSRQ